MLIGSQFFVLGYTHGLLDSVGLCCERLFAELRRRTGFVSACACMCRTHNQVVDCSSCVGAAVVCAAERAWSTPLSRPAARATCSAAW